MYFLLPLINYTTVTLEKMPASPSRFTVWCAHIRGKPSSPTTGSITCTAKRVVYTLACQGVPAMRRTDLGSSPVWVSWPFCSRDLDRIKCIGCFRKDGFEDCNKFLVTLLVSQHHFLVFQDHSWSLKTASSLLHRHSCMSHFITVLNRQLLTDALK